MRRSVAAVAIALALIGAVLDAAPASAQTDALLTAGDVSSGDCVPSVVLAGQLVDCSFPIPEGLSLDPWGPHHADIDLWYDEDNDEHPPCFIRGDRLLCPGVFVFYNSGERRVTPVVSGIAAAASATIRVLDDWSQPASFNSEWGGEPYVFPGNPLTMWVDGPARTEVRFAAIRSRDDGRLMATVDVPDVAGDSFDPISVDTGGLPVGRYLVTPCVGESRLRCQEVAGGVGFQVGTGHLREVIDGWNRLEADRINVVFAPSGDTDPESAMRLIRSLLGWDGPLPIGADDAVLTDPEPGAIWWVQFGPFAIEPLQSSRHVFNLWMLDDVLAHPRALDHTAPPMGWDRPPPDFGLPDVAVTAFDVQYPGEYARSEALWPSFSTPGGPATIERDGLVFSSSYLAVFASYPRSQAATLTHEWGHALFDLRDEYVESDRGVTYGYPNCAPDEATASEWWGALLGDVDPFFEEYISVLAKYGVSVDSELRDRVVTALVSGGCYSASANAVRPTVDSMMNSEIPVFGSVNRRRVEEVLALWSGRSPFSVDAVGVDCDLVVRRERVGFCSVEIAPFVDPPVGPMVLITDSGDLRCDPAVAVDEVYRAHCGVVRLAGDGPWEMTVAADGESALVTVTTG
jgi:hypothetical protein